MYNICKFINYFIYQSNIIRLHQLVYYIKLYITISVTNIILQSRAEIPFEIFFFIFFAYFIKHQHGSILKISSMTWKTAKLNVRKKKIYLFILLNIYIHIIYTLCLWMLKGSECMRWSVFNKVKLIVQRHMYI